MATTLWLSGRLDTLDPETSPAQMASLARALLATTRQLFGGGSEPDDEGLTELLAAIAASPVGDAPHR